MTNRTYTILANAARLRETANRFLQEALDAEGLSEISPACGDVFGCLLSVDAATVSEIARRTRRTKATISVMVDRLERLGYVEKVSADGDRRLVFVRLTPAGRALEPTLSALSERLNAKLTAGFSPEEAEMLEALLVRSLSNFNPPE